MSDRKITIRVKTRDSNVKDVEVDPEWTIPRLKEELEKATGTAPSLQRLIYMGKVLKDDHTISTYGIKEFDTIHLVKKPENSAPSTTSQNPSAGQISNTNDSTTATYTYNFQSNPQTQGQLMMGTITVPEGQSVPDISTILRGVLSGIGQGGSGTATVHAQAGPIPFPPGNLNPTIPNSVNPGTQIPSSPPITSSPPQNHPSEQGPSQYAYVPLMYASPALPTIASVHVHIHASPAELDQLPSRLDRLAQQIPFQNSAGSPWSQQFFGAAPGESSAPHIPPFNYPHHNNNQNIPHPTPQPPFSTSPSSPPPPPEQLASITISTEQVGFSPLLSMRNQGLPAGTRIISRTGPRPINPTTQQNNGQPGIVGGFMQVQQLVSGRVLTPGTMANQQGSPNPPATAPPPQQPPPPPPPSTPPPPPSAPATTNVPPSTESTPTPVLQSILNTLTNTLRTSQQTGESPSLSTIASSMSNIPGLETTGSDTVLERIMSKAFEVLTLPDMMALMGGDWTPVDRMQNAMKEYFVEELQRRTPEGDALSESNIIEWSRSTANAAIVAMKANTSVMSELSRHCSVANTPVALWETERLILKHLKLLVSTTLNGPAPPLPTQYCRAVRQILIEFLGKWVQKLSGLFNRGMDDIQVFVASVVNAFIGTITQTHPEFAIVASFGTSLAVKFVMNCYSEYSANPTVDEEDILPITERPVITDESTESRKRKEREGEVPTRAVLKKLEWMTDDKFTEEEKESILKALQEDGEALKELSHQPS